MKYTFSIAIILLLISSCTNDFNVKNKFNVKLHLNKGDKFIITNTTQNETNVEVQGKETQTNNTTTTSLKYDVISDSVGYKKIQINFESFKTIIKNENKQQEYDMADTSANNTLSVFFKKLKEMKAFLTISPQGKIVSVQGIKDLTDSLINSSSINNPTTKQMMKGQLSSILGDDLVKSNIEQSLHIFPDSAITVHHQWKKQTAITTPFPLQYDNVYEFVKAKDNVGYVEANAIITAKKSTMNVMGTSVTADFDGKQTANYEVNLVNGLIVKSNSKLNMEGTMQIMGKEVPITVKTSTTISSKKL